MTTEEKFRAAVNVIRGLPKKGSYQPSTDLMLKFYGLFKQATEGSNRTPKPYLWDVVKRTKWEAWNRLGNMEKEDAMLEYLRELNVIVETMGANENVDDFLQGMDEFYAKVPAKDVDLCIGETVEKIKARSNKPLPSHESVKESTAVTPTNKLEDDEEESFLDSLDTMMVPDNRNTTNQLVFINGHAHSKDFRPETTSDILMRTVLTIRSELNDVNSSIAKLEQQFKSFSRGRSRLFGNLSPQTIAFITLWPIFVNLGLLWMFSKRKRTQ